MDKKLKARWVKALCSGKYEQGNGYLLHDGKHCCLGVLADIMKLPAYDSSGEGAAYLRFNKLLSGDETTTGLYDLNDDGVPFEVIAGLIDAAL